MLKRMKESHNIWVNRLVYSEFRGEAPFVGVFTYREPELLILDPKLVNELFVGKFKHFQNNYTNVSIQDEQKEFGC